MRRQKSNWLTNESSGHSELEGNGHPWLSCDHYNQVQQKIGPSIVLAMSGARNLFCVVIIHYMSVCELLRKVYINFKYQPGFFVLQCIDRGWHWIQDRLGRLALKTFPLFPPLLNKTQIIPDYIEGRRGLYFVTTRMRQLRRWRRRGQNTKQCPDCYRSGLPGPGAINFDGFSSAHGAGWKQRSLVPNIIHLR